MTIDAKLQTIAPETQSLSIGDRAKLINIARPQINFGPTDIKELATAYLAAHMYALTTRNGASGYLTSEKEGDLSRGFSNNADAGSYGQTSYGMELQRLMRMFIMNTRTRQVTR